jgi:hypothetical protein
MAGMTRRSHLPPAPAIATAAQRCASTIRQQVATALLMGLAQRGWSLRQAARAARLSPTKPSSLLAAEHGPDLPILAQLLRPLGYAVSVWYRPWNAPDPPVLIRPTRAAARRVRSLNAATLTMLTHLLPTLGHLVQDPDAAAIRAAYARHGSIAATAAALQVSSVWLRAAMRRLDIPVRSYLRGTPATRRARNRQIIHDVTNGQTCEQIGQHYGITRSRVQQILQNQGIDIRALRRRQRGRDR